MSDPAPHSDGEGRRRRSVSLALAGGLALIALAIGLTLAGSPVVVIATNRIQPQAIVATTRGHTSGCQPGEVLPAGTTGIRLWITGNVKPSVRVRALAGTRVIAEGSNGGGWLGKVVTVPVARVARTVPDATICFALGPAVEEVDLLGELGSTHRHHRRAAKMRIEYLRSGSDSWWSLVSPVARRIGLGRAPSGALVALIPLALMALAAGLTVATLLRQLGRRPRRPGEDGRLLPAQAQADGEPTQAQSFGEPARAQSGATRARGAGLRRMCPPAPALLCAAVALLSAASWSILTPPFQVTDEPSHFAYAQIVAETGALPREYSDNFSPLERTAMEDLNYQGVHFNPAVKTISTVAQQRVLQSDLTAGLSGVGLGAGVASPQPPLYYTLEAIPYELDPGGTLLDRLALMRLLSALMGGLTALFGYLFLREALPGVPWAWTVGGLTLALAPLLGFISGAVNPDAMLCTVSTALFYCLARAFRRGFTTRSAIAIGAISAIGFLTKLNFLGLAPGVVLALAILTRRAARGSPAAAGGRAGAYRALALALAIAAAPACVYALVNVLSHHSGLGLASTGINSTSQHGGSRLGELEYIWESYLPRLPGMPNDFPGVSALRQLWFDRSVGLYGWLDTHFPNWVYNVALIAAGLIALLCARALLRARAALRARAGELFAYAVMGLGLLVLIGADSYLEFPTRAGGYSEPRYLLPLAALFAAILALAARGAGRRWGPAVGTLIVLLILAHDIFSQLLVVGRYYI
jgi:Predicted membrane protein (DUF2142)